MLKDLGSVVALTPREVQILELVANGYSAKEIGGELSIAPRTVERHAESARLKMRARNRAHMIMKAVAAGILKIPLDSEPEGVPEGNDLE